MDKTLAHDHSELDQLLGKLLTALETGDLEQSHARLDFFWARLAVHIRAEHLHLFPAIIQSIHQNRAKDGPSIPEALGALNQLRHDHDVFMHELSGAMQLMRQLLTNHGSVTNSHGIAEARAKVVAVNDLLAAHNDLEENQVYLWADKLLNSSERAALEVKLQHEIENTPPRFSKSAHL